MKQIFKRMFIESLQDDTGRFSHARILAMVVAIGATVFMWKLILTGGMDIEYFLAYLAYGTSHQTLNKYLDSRNGGNNNNGNNNFPRNPTPPKYRDLPRRKDPEPDHPVARGKTSFDDDDRY